jgi:hypothetical protein
VTVLEMVLIGPVAGALVPLVLFGPRIVGRRARRREVAGYDGDGKPPSERRRRRAKARAEAPQHEPVPEADRELVEVMHWMVVKARTDEQPVVRPVCRRRVARRPARWQRVAAARRAARRATRPVRTFAASPLTAPLAGPLAPPVLCSSEPDPWGLEGFTREWETGEFAAVVAAAAKAGAR